MPTPSNQFSDIGEFQPADDGWWYGKPGDNPGLKKVLSDLGIDIIHRVDADSNKSNWDPETGAALYAEDTEELYLGDGTQWNGQDTWGKTPDFDGVSVDQQPVQTALDGYVVPVAPGLGVVDAVDPASTSKPVQDALDAASTAGGGGIILPPTTVNEETGDISLRSGVNIVGWPNATEIVIDSDASGLIVDTDNIRRCHYYGFMIRAGVGQSNSTGAGIHITGSNSIADSQFNFIHIKDFHQGHVVDGDQFACKFPYLRMSTCNSGDTNGLIDYRTQGRPPSQYGLLHVYPNGNNGTTDILYNYNTEISVRQLNVGGDVGRVINSTYGRVDIGQIHYEPNEQTTIPSEIVKIGGARGSRVGMIKNHGGTADYAYTASGGPGQMILGAYNAVAGGTLNNNIVHIDGSFESPSDYISVGASHDEIDLTSVSKSSRRYINPLGSRAMPIDTWTGKSVAAGVSDNLAVTEFGGNPADLSTGQVSWNVTNRGSIAADYGISIDKVWYDNSAGQVKIAYSETENAVSTALSVDFTLWAK